MDCSSCLVLLLSRLISRREGRWRWGLVLVGVLSVRLPVISKKGDQSGNDGENQGSLILCVGGVLYQIVFHKLQPQIGFPWAIRVMAFIILGTMLFPLVFLKARLKPSSARKMFDITALRETTFVLFGLGIFFMYMGLCKSKNPKQYSVIELIHELRHYFRRSRELPSKNSFLLK